MAKKISFSPDVLRFEEVAISHSDIEKSIHHYYSNPSLHQLDAKFVGYSPSEIEQERNKRLDDLNVNSVFNILAAIEASLRVDFYVRCYERKKDVLSRYFRSIHKEYGNNISFEETILDGWKTHVPKSGDLMSEIKGAFHYRHWLAHGRYWLPKVRTNYDFFSVSLLAQQLRQLSLYTN